MFNIITVTNKSKVVGVTCFKNNKAIWCLSLCAGKGVTDPTAWQINYKKFLTLKQFARLKKCISKKYKALKGYNINAFHAPV